MITLDMQSRLPIYEQLKAKISELVVLDILKPDDQLPSVRSLARDLGVNPNTVQKAYQELERDGIIYSRGGKGSFVSGESTVNKQMQAQALERFSSSVRDCLAMRVTRDTLISTMDAVMLQREPS